MSLMAVLLGIGTFLTAFMFISKQRLLGFPSAIFFALGGGQAFTLSTAAWDMYFLIGFASTLGMISFCSLGAYALREKHDAYAEEEMDEESTEKEPRLVDEKPEPKIDYNRRMKPTERAALRRKRVRREL